MYDLIHGNNHLVRDELLRADLRALRLFSRHVNKYRDPRNGQESRLQHVNFYSERPHDELSVDGTEAEIRHDLLSYSLGCPQDEKSQVNASRFLIALKQGLVPLSLVEWLLENERACLFFFLCMATRLPKPNLQKSLSVAREEFKGSIPQGHKARYKFFLEALEDSDMSQDKTEFVAYLERGYAAAQQRVKPLPWLKPDNDGACQWAWDYLLHAHESKVEAFNKAQHDVVGFNCDVAPLPLLFWLVPHGEQEQEMAFYAALQTWKCSDAELTLFRTNISKAWRQRQLRRSDKFRAINTHIRAESKEQLDALSRRAGLSLQKTLESIIETAYREMSSGSSHR
ncbi:hypothetical protein ACLPHM_03190 [Paenalcaligenes sp. Me131]|uniref:hypothetical protein n=1 Tax=Paenalcaligenes sp. Me131 TaxID=3392636 RepID=UPI003D29A435